MPARGRAAHASARAQPAPARAAQGAEGPTGRRVGVRRRCAPLAIERRGRHDLRGGVAARDSRARLGPRARGRAEGKGARGRPWRRLRRAASGRGTRRRRRSCAARPVSTEGGTRRVQLVREGDAQAPAQLCGAAPHVLAQTLSESLGGAQGSAWAVRGARRADGAAARGGGGTRRVHLVRGGGRDLSGQCGEGGGGGRERGAGAGPGVRRGWAGRRRTARR
jgi:hypothetical protein